jgi:hypothetical protein
MGKLIYSTTDLETASAEVLEDVDSALVAAAYRIRDNMRASFVSGSSLYKRSTPGYAGLADGIVLGKLDNSKITIHAMGDKSVPATWKTRLFVGGTIERTQTKRQGKSIKPYSKGYIRANEAIDKGLAGAQNILESYINTALNG